ncbi:MAG: alkaline phosphatase, partial [Anaerolineae bacterium]|nr:alkaline phosphatase [Anaerolineae bacterium]
MKSNLLLKPILLVLLLAILLPACTPAAPPSPTPQPPTATSPPQPSATSAPTSAPTQTTAPLPTDTPPPTMESTVGPAAGIILFIGDGMGEAQRTAGRWLSMGQDGQLAMDQMPVSGWSETRSLSSPITDSAAGATALASGIRTKNHRVGVDAEGNPTATILEQAKRLGWSVGLVTTTQMAHATPAAFAAHVLERNDMVEIALQMHTLGIDVLLGGGEDEFLPHGTTGCFPEFGERSDGRNLIEEAQTAGYTYVCDAAALNALDPASTPRLLGLFADEGISRPFAPSLADMTKIAIQILSQNPNGFFLMVEGGQVDWASHDNKAEETMRSVLGLDSAVAVAQVYAATHPD